MRALLIQHGCEAALEVLPAYMEAEVKAKLNKKAHSVVIFMSGSSYDMLCVGWKSKISKAYGWWIIIELFPWFIADPLTYNMGQGEVKGGGVDFGVINSLLGEILREVMGEME
ncbi:hypothetical protein Tco_0266408 [Tanacetum coccineum]